MLRGEGGSFAPPDRNRTPPSREPRVPTTCPARPGSSRPRRHRLGKLIAEAVGRLLNSLAEPCIASIVFVAFIVFSWDSRLHQSAMSRARSFVHNAPGWRGGQVDARDLDDGVPRGFLIGVLVKV